MLRGCGRLEPGSGAIAEGEPAGFWHGARRAFARQLATKMSQSTRRTGSPSSRIAGTIDFMNEAHFKEIEKTLLFISEARKRAERAAANIESDGAEPHLVAALKQAERELEELGRWLMQQTYFAVPNDQLSIEPDKALTLP
jgi:hypothetical protein